MTATVAPLSRAIRASTASRSESAAGTGAPASASSMSGVMGEEDSTR